MKRTRILSALVASAAFFTSPLVSAEGYSGQFVLGVDVGIASRSGKLNSDYHTLAGAPAALLAVAAPGTQVASHVQKISDNGSTMGGLAGYQVWYGDWLVGLEGHIDWARYEEVKYFSMPSSNAAVVAAGHTFTNSHATYRQGTHYGVTTRVGFRALSFLTPYVRVGAEYSEHELALTHFLTIVPPVAPTPFDHYTHKKGLWSWVFGAGFELPFFSDKTSLRLEYNYNPGTTLRFFESVDALAGTHRIKERTHTGKLAWTWNFG